MAKIANIKSTLMYLNKQFNTKNVHYALTILIDFENDTRNELSGYQT